MNLLEINLKDMTPADMADLECVKEADYLLAGGRCYITTQHMAAVVGWKHDNMMRSVAAYLKRSDWAAPCGAGCWLELPVAQRFLKWLIDTALKGKPVLQRMRYSSFSESALAPLLGLSDTGVPERVDNCYRHLSGYRAGTWTRQRSQEEEMLMSWRESGYRGGFSLPALARLAGFSSADTRAILKSRNANDPRVKLPTQDGAVDDYSALTVMTHTKAARATREAVIEHLWRRAPFSINPADLPDMCKEEDVSTSEGVLRVLHLMEAAIKNAETELQIVRAESSKALHEKEADLIVTRAKLAGKEAECADLKRGLSSACSAGFYVGTGKHVMATARLRKLHGLITVSDVAQHSLHAFVDARGNPLNPRLMGSLRVTPANVQTQVGKLLQHMVLVAKNKAGDTPHVKPSMAGLALVHRVKVSDASSAAHIAKHGIGLRAVDSVFFSRAIIPWFVANGPPCIDSWADAGYAMPS